MAITLVLGVCLGLVALTVNTMIVSLLVVGILNRTSYGYSLVCKS